MTAGMYAARTIRFLLGYLVTLLLYLAWDYYSAPVTLHLPSYFLIFIFSFALSLFMLSLLTSLDVQASFLVVVFIIIINCMLIQGDHLLLRPLRPTPVVG